MTVSASPYRTAFSPRAARAVELVYRTTDPERHVTAVRAAAQAWIAGVVFASVVYASGFETLSGVVLVLALVATLLAVRCASPTRRGWSCACARRKACSR